MAHQLPDFYNQYAYDANTFKPLLDAYEGAYKLVAEIIEQVADDQIISKRGTYRRIPFQLINVTDATYDLAQVLSSQKIIDQFGLGNLSMDQKMDNWNKTMTITEKMDILESYGAYATLASVDKSTGKLKNINVVSFEAYTDTQIPLIKNLDYAYRNNNLYLFRDIGENRAGQQRSLILKNIYIDLHSAEYLGKFIGVNYNNALVKMNSETCHKHFCMQHLEGLQLKTLISLLAALLLMVDL